MSQPDDPVVANKIHDLHAGHGGPAPKMRVLALAGALGLLATADIWLVREAAQAVLAVPPQLGAPLVPGLAAMGCTAMAGVALALTWLLARDLTDSLREILSDVWHQS